MLIASCLIPSYTQSPFSLLLFTVKLLQLITSQFASCIFDIDIAYKLDPSKAIIVVGELVNSVHLLVGARELVLQLSVKSASERASILLFEVALIKEELHCFWKFQGEEERVSDLIPYVGS